jgi:dolichol kinase
VGWAIKVHLPSPEDHLFSTITNITHSNTKTSRRDRPTTSIAAAKMTAATKQLIFLIFEPNSLLLFHSLMISSPFIHSLSSPHEELFFSDLFFLLLSSILSSFFQEDDEDSGEEKREYFYFSSCFIIAVYCDSPPLLNLWLATGTLLS